MAIKVVIEINKGSNLADLLEQYLAFRVGKKDEREYATDLFRERAVDIALEAEAENGWWFGKS